MSYKRKPSGVECPDCGHDVNHPLDVICDRCGAHPEFYCTSESGYALPYYHQARLDVSHAHLCAATKLARFIDRDGHSFFDRVVPGRSVWMRVEVDKPTWTVAMFGSQEFNDISARKVVYHREVWRLAYGPLAAPTWDTYLREWLDVVYQYQSG